MAKQPKVKSAFELNTVFTKDLLIANVVEGDCFGSYDVMDKNCNPACHDKFACAMLLQYRIKDQVIKLESTQGPFLDQTTFPTTEQLKAIICVGAIYQDAFEYIKTLCVVPDERTLELHIDGYIRSQNLRVKAGVICE